MGSGFDFGSYGRVGISSDLRGHRVRRQRRVTTARAWKNRRI